MSIETAQMWESITNFTKIKNNQQMLGFFFDKFYERSLDDKINYLVYKFYDFQKIVYVTNKKKLQNRQKNGNFRLFFAIFV